MGPGLGPLSRLLTRKMYAQVDAAPSWDRNMWLCNEARAEIEFWMKNINRVNGYQLKREHAHTKIVYSDASEHGFGGYIAQRVGNVIAKGSFTAAERETSSTYRELLAVEQVLASLIDQLRHESVLWYTDNWNVSRILQVGSPKDHLQDLAMKIFSQCIRNDIFILPCWTPREDNQEADELSKHRDTDDWGIDGETFHFVQTVFGHMDIDRFADARNAKLARF